MWIFDGVATLKLDNVLLICLLSNVDCEDFFLNERFEMNILWISNCMCVLLGMTAD